MAPQFACEMEPQYRNELKGILSFASFAEAEETLKHLESLRRKYLSEGDRKGVAYCRQIAFLGRRRAEIIGRNSRVSLQKRLQKQEMTNWFRVWLETPDIFDSWLELRKNTTEFRDLLKSECTKKPLKSPYVSDSKTRQPALRNARRQRRKRQ